MSTVIVTVVSQEKSFPAGTVSSGIKVTLGDASQVLTAAPYVATFWNVGPGEHAITAVAVDANGADLGDVVTGSITIAEAPEAPAPEAPVAEPAPEPAPEVTINVPASLSVEVK